jgi:hypothetical protein
MPWAAELFSLLTWALVGVLQNITASGRRFFTGFLNIRAAGFTSF